jgi:hypothetical protein
MVIGAMDAAHPKLKQYLDSFRMPFYEDRKLCPGTQIIYIGLFTRHVEQCCKEAGHMRQEDIGAMHVARREFDKGVKDKVGGEFECWEWQDVLGVEKEITMREMRDRGIVGRDGVHMERAWVRKAAVNISCRVVEGAVVVREGEGEAKRNKGDELE